MNVHVPSSDADLQDLPEWDLADLYLGRDDPAIARDLDGARAAVEELVKLKGGFIAARSQPERLALVLAQAVGLYEKVSDLLLKPSPSATPCSRPSAGARRTPCPRRSARAPRCSACA